MQIRLNKPFALNETGGGKRNEDSIFPEKGKATAEDCCFMVCDGIGGHRGGDIASRTVCKSFAAFLKETGFRNFNETIFEHALEYAVEQLDDADPETGGRSMGTTLTFVYFHARGVFMAHIGDSRIYHLRKQGGQVGILYKSHDHSLVNDLIRAELITPEEALTHPKKNVITRALMSRQEKQPQAEIRETDDVREGDYFFLCTDGVLEQLSDDRLCEIIARETDDSAKIDAIYKACQGYSHDNFSAWLIPVAAVFDELGTAPPEHETAAPTLLPADDRFPQTPAKRKRIWVHVLLCGLLIVGVYAGFRWIHDSDKKSKPANKEQQTSRKKPQDTNKEQQAPRKEPLNTKDQKTETEQKQQTGTDVTPPNTTSPKKYDSKADFQEGLASVQLNGKYGFIDRTGKEVIPLKYDSARSFREGFVSVQLNGKWGFIDKSGKEVIPFKYDNAYGFNEGIVWVKLNGKLGLIDKTGKEVIPFKYDRVWSFKEGFATVELNGKWGFIDRTGKEVIPLIYNQATSFREGSALVQLNGKWFYIDKTGKCVKDCPE